MTRGSRREQVCAFPEELPFARLAWTGSRILNRIMRLQAIALGINLGAHAIRTPIVLARLRPHFGRTLREGVEDVECRAL